MQILTAHFLATFTTHIIEVRKFQKKAIIGKWPFIFWGWNEIINVPTLLSLSYIGENKIFMDTG